MVFLFSGGYVLWNQIVHWKNGCWPYPFQKQLEAPPVQVAYLVGVIAAHFGQIHPGHTCFCEAVAKKAAIECENTVQVAYIVVLLLLICGLYFVGRRCNKKRQSYGDMTPRMNDAVREMGLQRSLQ